ncbi:hypothetical protein BFJ70_g16401 [Fusarium oxysporum]|nr:hypothetical protein FOMA001_g19802 [Fusarium oxysporum f. sp. matthiolae]RKL11357.1 hypothetical protein BFJ70_g16401 [Fusarium oxysporum]
MSGVDCVRSLRRSRAQRQRSTALFGAVEGRKKDGKEMMKFPNVLGVVPPTYSLVPEEVLLVDAEARFKVCHCQADALTGACGTWTPGLLLDLVKEYVTLH